MNGSLARAADSRFFLTSGRFFSFLVTHFSHLLVFSKLFISSIFTYAMKISTFETLFLSLSSCFLLSFEVSYEAWSDFLPLIGSLSIPLSSEFISFLRKVVHLFYFQILLLSFELPEKHGYCLYFEKSSRLHMAENTYSNEYSKSKNEESIPASFVFVRSWARLTTLLLGSSSELLGSSLDDSSVFLTCNGTGGFINFLSFYYFLFYAHCVKHYLLEMIQQFS